MLARGALGALGVLLASYGVVLLVTRQDFEQIRDAVVWLVVGVLVHDGMLVPSVLALGLLAGRVLPAAYRRTATVVLVLVGPLSLLAVPVLGRLGARPDNPTLLDRPYLATWCVLLLVSVVAVVGAGRVVRSVHGTDEETEGGAADGTGLGRR